MTTLNIGADPKMGNNLPPTDASSESIRSSIVKHVAVGGGISVVALVILSALSIVKADPKDAFPLLTAWGPKAVGGVVLIYVVYDIIRIVLRAFTKGMRWVGSLVQRQVVSGERTSVALEKLAAKDDRQTQEMQTLTAYTAQQGERTHDKIVDVGHKVDLLVTRLDQYMQEKKP